MASTNPFPDYILLRIEDLEQRVAELLPLLPFLLIDEIEPLPTTLTVSITTPDPVPTENP